MEISAGNKTAILIGASGLVGGYCLHYLLANPAYNKVICLGRKKIMVESEKLEQHKINFDKYGSYAPYVKGNDLFITLGTTMAKAGSKTEFRKVDHDYVLNVAKAGYDNGVDQIILVSSVGANATSLFFYNRVKGELEEAIKALGYWAVHIFQPSLLLGERPESRIGESAAKILGKGLDFVLRGLLTKYKPVEAETVAKAMVNAAQKLTSGNHIYASHWLQEMAEKEDELRRLSE